MACPLLLKLNVWNNAVGACIAVQCIQQMRASSRCALQHGGPDRLRVGVAGDEGAVLLASKRR